MPRCRLPLQWTPCASLKIFSGCIIYRESPKPALLPGGNYYLGIYLGLILFYLYTVYVRRDYPCRVAYLRTNYNNNNIYYRGFARTLGIHNADKHRKSSILHGVLIAIATGPYFFLARSKMRFEKNIMIKPSRVTHTVHHECNVGVYYSLDILLFLPVIFSMCEY